MSSMKILNSRSRLGLNNACTKRGAVMSPGGIIMGSISRSEVYTF